MRKTLAIIILLLFAVPAHADTSIVFGILPDNIASKLYFMRGFPDRIMTVRHETTDTADHLWIAGMAYYYKSFLMKAIDWNKDGIYDQLEIFKCEAKTNQRTFSEFFQPKKKLIGGMNILAAADIQTILDYLASNKAELLEEWMLFEALEMWLMIGETGTSE